MKLFTWAFLTTLLLYLSSTMSVASSPQPKTIDVNFLQSVDLPIGTAVLVDGQRVGHLMQLGTNNKSAKLALTDQSTKLRSGAMAVVSSTWVNQQQGAQYFIEILNPSTKLATHSETKEELIAYPDFESFWSNKKHQHWIDKQS